MFRRQGVTVATAVAVLTTVTACGGPSGDSSPAAGDTDFSAEATGTVSSWSFDNADDVGQARIDYADAELEKTGASVTYDQTTFDAQKFTTRLASGDVPDVVQMDRQFVATYAAQGLILPLDKCYSDNETDPATMYYEAVLDDVTYEDQVWAVPQFYQPLAIMVNGDVLAEAGVTNAELDTSKPDAMLAAISKMYASDGDVPTTLGFDPQAATNANLWVVGLGGRLSDENGAPTLDDPANVYPLELLKKITDAQGGYAKVKSFTDSFDFFGAKNQFVQKQVGAQVAAQWYPNVLSPYTNQIKLQTVPFKAQDGTPITVTGGSAFVIPAKAKNPAAACQWALGVNSMGAWTAAEEARVATLAENKGLNTGLFTGQPAVDEALRAYVKPSGNADFDQTVQAFYDVVDKGKSIGASPAGQTIKTDLINAVTATLLGQKSAEDALAAAQQSSMRAYERVVK